MHDSKVCFKCNVMKPLSEFYEHSEMADGHVNKCKECNKKDVHENRLKNIDYYRRYDIERAKNPERAKAAYELISNWRKSDKRITSAHNKVARALRKGILTKQPCCICGSDKSIAHHESYDKPLDVVWYCQIHHKERHKEMVLNDIEP